MFRYDTADKAEVSGRTYKSIDLTRRLARHAGDLRVSAPRFDADRRPGAVLDAHRGMYGMPMHTPQRRAFRRDR